MNDGTQVIWERTIDHEAAARRWKLLGMWYGLPLAVVTLGVGVIEGPWSSLGVLILFGGFGLLLVAWIWFHNHNLRANPTVILDNGHLRLGRNQVPTAMVQRWTTYPRKISTATPNSSGGTTSGAITVHVAGFMLSTVNPDGSKGREEREFVWPQLSEADQVSMRAAIDGVIPGLWVPLESFRS